MKKGKGKQGPRDDNNYKKYNVERLAERVFVSCPRVISFSHRGLCSVRHPFLPLVMDSLPDSPAYQKKSLVDGLLAALLESQQETEKWSRVEQMFDSKMHYSDLDTKRNDIMLSYPVTSKIEALWTIALNGKHSTVLTEESYHLFHQLLYAIVFKTDDRSLKPATIGAIKEDYEYDTRGREGVSFESFSISILEFADNWTPSREVRDYVSFLENIVCVLRPPHETPDAPEVEKVSIPDAAYFSSALLSKRLVNGRIEYYKCGV